jgi:DNA-binding transcriptional ArsR family regulator
MVNYADRRMDAVFSALADSTRRGMIRRLSRGPATIGELGRPYPITKPAITRHVKILEGAGLVRRERDGRLHVCSLRAEQMREAEAWIERYRTFWEGSLGSLAKLVEGS